MTTIQTKVRNGLVTTALAGCVVLVSAPAYGAVAPEAEQPAATSQLSKAAIEHYEADTTGTASVGRQLTKAEIAHYEADTTGASSSVPGVLGAQTKAQIEQMERAAQQQGAANAGTTSGSSSDGDGSVLVTVLALLGGGLITGAAGAYTVSRMRHAGPASPRTA
jgi:hypothetical protein